MAIDGPAHSMAAIFGIILLLGLNAFFVLAEFALVRIRKTRLEELAQRGDGRAALALKMVSRIDSYLSAVQLGVTLASLGLGWMGEPAVSSWIEPLVFQYFPGSNFSDWRPSSGPWKTHQTWRTPADGGRTRPSSCR